MKTHALFHLLLKALTLINQGLCWLLIKVIRGYQIVLSPIMGNQCRFTPTCSHYSIEAIKSHGAFKGLALTLWRLLRCNPWGGHGKDPVPPRKACCEPDHD